MTDVDDTDADLARIAHDEAVAREAEAKRLRTQATVFEIRLARMMGKGCADASGTCKYCGVEMGRDGDGNWLHLPPLCPGPPVTCTCGDRVQHHDTGRDVFNLDGTPHVCSRARLVTRARPVESTLPYSLRVPRRTYGEDY